MEKVKDELMRVGAVLKFHINKALIDSVKDSLSKYNADLEMKKSRKKKKVVELSKNGKLMKLKKKSQAENSFFIAEENVVESSSKLQEALRKNSLSHDKSMW